MVVSWPPCWVAVEVNTLATLPINTMRVHHPARRRGRSVAACGASTGHPANLKDGAPVFDPCGTSRRSYFDKYALMGARRRTGEVSMSNLKGKVAVVTG